MTKTQKILNRIIYHIPKQLPVSKLDFPQWASDICQTYNMPDNNSTHHALAISIMHLPPTAAFKPRAYFGHMLIKGAAQEIAYSVIQDVQAQKAEEIKAAQQAAATLHAEATAQPTEAVATSGTEEKTNA